MLRFIYLLLLASLYTNPSDSDRKASFEKLKQHAEALRQYAKKQNASSRLGILVDMSIPSWKKRIFLVDLDNDSVLVSGLCAHGQGTDYRREEVVFSNVPGSYCTSEGRYKLGGKFYGEYGWAYRLYGLDATNSNALKRIVVFHYYPSVLDVEDSTFCRSNGCPMVSPSVFQSTAKFIDASKQPVLMWIYK